MASINSTLFTIGTALARAKDADVAVQLLVSGQWMHGVVGEIDGHGVMLIGDYDELSIIRVQQIDAVKVLRGSAFTDRPEVEANGSQAHPMPAASADRY